MYTIIDTSTNKLLFVKSDNEVLECQTAIEQICILDNPEQKDIYYNFETKTFYI